MHLVKVNATLLNNDSYIQDDYKTEHEYYELHLSLSTNANEGIQV